MSLTAARLDRFFERSTTRLGGTLPIRKTNIGIWVPTPVPVIMAAAAVLEELGVLRRQWNLVKFLYFEGASQRLGNYVS